MCLLDVFKLVELAAFVSSILCFDEPLGSTDASIVLDILVAQYSSKLRFLWT